MSIWSKSNIALAEEMWRQGHTSDEIGQRFGVTRGAVTAMAVKNRDRFPARHNPSDRKVDKERAARIARAAARASAPVLVKPRKNRTNLGDGVWVDRVPYTTLAGAVVSLPRVSILDVQGAAE